MKLGANADRGYYDLRGFCYTPAFDFFPVIGDEKFPPVSMLTEIIFPSR